MKSYIKFPFLALLALVTIEATATSSALAGQSQVAPSTDASGSTGIEFTPGNNASSGFNSETAAAVKSTLTSAANEIASSGQAVSALGQTLSLTPAQVAAISQALSLPANASPAAVEAAANNLVAQLAADLPAGVTIDAGDVASVLVTLNATPANLPAAVSALNALVDSLTLEELKAIASSPVFAAMRQVVASGNSAASANR